MRKYEREMEGIDSHNHLLGYYVALDWKASARDLVRLSGKRQMEETFYGENRYFNDTVVSLYGAHKLTDKFTASLDLAWENMHYSRYVRDVKRNDNLWTVRPELDYQFKEWLSAGVWYQWRLRNSNANRFGGPYSGQSYDYHSNKAGVFVKAIF